MRTYENLADAFHEIEREVYEMGITTHPETMQDRYVGDDEQFMTKELMGYSYRIKMSKGMLYLRSLEEFFGKEEGRRCYDYCVTELGDRLQFHGDRVNPGMSWETRKSVWDQFREPSGEFSYTYSERMGPHLSKTLLLLAQAKDSRQIILPIWEPLIDMDRRSKRRVPCSMHYQFLRRGNELHMVYVMRSCDLYTHFPVDVTLACMLLEWVADKLQLEYGSMIHQIGSLHLYAKDAREGVF